VETFLVVRHAAWAHHLVVEMACRQEVSLLHVEEGRERVAYPLVADLLQACGVVERVACVEAYRLGQEAYLQVGRVACWVACWVL